MIPEIGHFALILCLALSIVQGVLPLVGAARGSGPLMAVARPAAAANALFGTIDRLRVPCVLVLYFRLQRAQRCQQLQLDAALVLQGRSDLGFS